MTYAQSYTQLAPGNEIGGQVLTVGAAAIEAYQNNKDKGTWAATKSALAATGEGVKPIAGEKAVTALGSMTGSSDTAKLLNSKAFGIRNPMLCLIYSSPQFRTFNFEFLLYPRDKNEAQMVQQILEKFRYHQAPEIKTGTGYLNPPSQFDIEISYNGEINPNIPNFKSCILINMSINYTRNGWQAYEIAGESPTLGGTGMPVGTQVIMTFQETEILTKADFKK
jgi:hypothetical protein